MNTTTSLIGEQPPQVAGKPLLSRADFAHRLGVCVHTIARYEKQGLIKGAKINARVVRYEESEYEKLIKGATV